MNMTRLLIHRSTDMTFRKTTEAVSHYDHLEDMEVMELLQNINREDLTVAETVRQQLPSIKDLVSAILPRMQKGGRLFYMGAGTSGRLGILDASECPPTYGVPHGMVIGIIAGGDSAIRKAVEFAEDNREQGWKDLTEFAIGDYDSVIGIAASGTTPYVIGALEKANEAGLLTGCITCNPGSPVTTVAQYPVVVETGPEFVTGSTRMKAGTAQKLVLNMISTSLMIRLGRVKGNRMVDMQLSNDKLIDRGTRMVMEGLNVDENTARELLLRHGNVRRTIESGRQG